MPTIDRFPIYLQFGLVKAVIGSESHYSSTPEGDLDVDRLIRSLPAFQSHDDSRRYIKKKLVINRLDPELYCNSRNYLAPKLSKLMTLRQLLVDGFEIYQYQAGQCVKLTPLALSELFLKSPSQLPDDTVHQAAIKQLGISFDDVAVLSQDNIEKITLPLSKLPQSLWLSDIYSLGSKEWHESALDELKETWEPRTSNFVVNYASSWIIFNLREHFRDKIQDYIFHIYKIQGSLVEQLIDSQNIDWSHLEKIIWQGTYYCDEEYVAEHFASLSSLMSSSSFLREVEINDIQEYPLSTTVVNLERLESIKLKQVGIAQPRLISLLQNAPQLKHLTLFNVTCPRDTSSEYPVLDNLQSLEIETRANIHDSLFSNPSTIRDFIKKIGPHLKKLRLKIKSSFDDCDWTNELSELEELNLSGSIVSDSGLRVLLRTMPHLKKLNLSYCSKLNINYSYSTFELKELEELNLEKSNVDGKLLADLLKHSTCLKSLNLSQCHKLHERACEFNVALSLLEEIELDSSTIQNKQLASILKDAVRLKELKLQYRTNKIDQTILLADDTPFKTMNLISLATFNPGVLLNKDQFISVLNAAPKLLNLGLEDDFLLGYLMREQECDAILEGRLLHLEKLRATLRENNQLHALIKHMPRLKVLDFSSRSETGLSLDAPVKGIEKLVSRSINTIKACQLVQFLQAASHLKTLDLMGCRNLIDDVGDFKAHLTNLSSIVLISSYVTDRFLLSLLSNVPILREINLGCCKIVTTSSSLTEQLKDSIAQLKMKNPECFPGLDYSPTYCLLSELPDKDRYKAKTIYPQGMGYEGNFSGQKQAYMKSQQTMIFNQTKTLDSDTTNKHTTFHLKKIFQSLTLGADSPGVHQYRLSCFNHYQENNNECSPHNAFSLDNEGDLQLTDISFEDLQSFDGGIKRLGKKCYYGKSKLQLSQEWQALPSVSSTEILTHLHVSIENVNIEVKYAKRDNLYYIRKKTGFPSFVELDFLVEEPGNLSDEKIPDVLQPLLDYCQNFKSLPLTISVDNPKGSDYLEALVSQATGSCRHRSLVLKVLMDNPLLRQKLPLPLRNELTSLPSYPVRIINNDCHSFVEIKINSQWVRVDLGGYAAQLDVDETPFKAFTSKSDVFEVTDESLDPCEQKVQFELTQESCLKPSGQTAQSVEKDYFPDMVLSEDIPSLDAYLQKSCQPTEDKLLILADSNQAAALNYHIQSYCQRSGRSVHYVHEPDDLMCQLPYADIKDLPDGRLQGELKQGPGGSMYRFLTQANFQEQRIIVVNFNHFPANKLASFNSLLDDLPNIDGVPLPLGTKVIGFLDRNHPQDASFYSRFAGNFSPCPYSSDELEVSSIIQDVEGEPTYKPEDILRIDLHGSLIWKSGLLGYWTLEGQTLYPFDIAG